MAELPRLATEYECVGCIACVSACKANAIYSYVAEDGHTYVQINEDKCVRCGKCEKLCNAIRTSYGVNRFSESEIYAGWANVDEQRKRGTSGGVFAAMASHIIRDGGVVAGAYFDGKESRHRIIRDENEIAELQGSKYVWSSLEGIYPLMEEELKDHKVLFTGVGCQCSAVINYFKNNRYKDNLYTVDLVCGGVPSRLLVERYLDENIDVERIVSFRTKDKYELKVFSHDGKIVPGGGTKTLPLDGYSCGMTNRYSCYDCQFAYAHRKSDVTIGDLWNKDLFQNERKKGISVLIVHGEKGRELVKHADIAMKDVSWKDVIYMNKRIVYGKQKILLPRKMLGWAFKHMSYRNLMKLYCVDIKKYDIPWMVYRTVRFLRNKKDEKTAIRCLNAVMAANTDTDK